MSADAFSGLPRTEGNHFLAHFRATVFLLIRFLRSLEPPSELADGDSALDGVLTRFPFLAAYLHDLSAMLPQDLTWEDAALWWRDGIEDWERPRRGLLPLGTLSSYADLGFAHRVGLVCAGLVEEDARFGDMFAQLMPGTSSRRVTVDFLGQLMLDIDATISTSPRGAVEPLAALGLIRTLQPDAPFAERPIAVPETVWKLIRDGIAETLDEWCEYLPRSRAVALKSLPFPETFQTELAGVPTLLARSDEALLIVRGVGGSDRRAVVRAVARSLRYNVLAVTVDAELSAERRALIAPLALLTHSLPLLSMDPAPGMTLPLPSLPGYRGVRVVILSTVGGIDADAAGNALTLTLPRLGERERALHWAEGLAGFAPADMESLVRRYLLPGEHIRRVAAGAIAYARLAQRHTVNDEDVARAHRHLNRQLLDKLAEPLSVGGGNDAWETLITGESVTTRLRQLESRCRLRERLAEHLGEAFRRGENRGVRALFNGPSGTGKTLAARTLAAVLGMDIYRVDLAAIVNKYIGETEKNLHEVLSRAEELDVILLIDEGDALMGKRTEVSNANDRYANLETNYLLQRLEAHQGIVLVTTNVGDNIDGAFQRRMDVAIDFTNPNAAERVRIWRLHLAEGHAVSDQELAMIAAKGDFTGGQIRNAAVLATLLAMEDNAGIVTFAHLRLALESEYRKAGSVSRMADAEAAPVVASGGKVAAYIDSLRSG